MSEISIFDILQMTANAVTTLGLPLALVMYVRDLRQSRREREYGTYDALDDRYSSFLQTCLQYPELGVFGAVSVDDSAWSAEKKAQREMLFSILISLMERACLMYADQANEVKRRQWTGWQAYIEDYFRNRAFCDMWDSQTGQFDTGFAEEMNRIRMRMDRSDGRG